MKRITPAEKISARNPEYSFPISISGAIKPAVPTYVISLPGDSFAKPKSDIIKLKS